MNNDEYDEKILTFISPHPSNLSLTFANNLLKFFEEKEPPPRPLPSPKLPPPSSQPLHSLSVTTLDLKEKEELEEKELEEKELEEKEEEEEEKNVIFERF